MGAAALLGGWSLLNRDRPQRDALVGMALLGAIVLIASATVFVMQREWDREQERSRQEWQDKLNELERETRERSHP